jgi:hypothetical protein
VHAQLTLTQANSQYQINGNLDLDSVYIFSSNVPKLSAGADQNWNLSGPSTGTIDWYRYYKPDAGSIPGTTLVARAFINFSQLSYTQFEQQRVTAAGRQELGLVVTRQPLPISAVTGTPTDSLVFLKQTVVYDKPMRILTFPLNMGTSWKDTIRQKLDFTLTATALGLTKVPGERRSRHIQQASVVAWGKMTVRNRQGQPGTPQPVLCVRYSSVFRDSFYLGGLPAPAVLLSGFGLQQGQTSNYYADHYYRANEASPLCTVQFSDPGFSNIKEVVTHLERVGVGISGIGNPAVEALNVKVSPNPVSEHRQIHLDFGDQTGDFQFELFDPMGRTVLQRSLEKSERIALPVGLPTGLYFYAIKDREYRAGTDGILVLQ